MNSLSNFKKSIAPFGLRHEIAKRYTPVDWLRSRKVAKLIDSTGADKKISMLLLQNKPALIGRLGGTEARFLGEYFKLKTLKKLGVPLSISSRLSRRWKVRRREVFTNAGFYFNSWNDVEMFASLYSAALKVTDILGAWGVAFTWVEGRYLDPAKTQLIPVGHTAPWVEPYVEINHGELLGPWSHALAGKRVLVISSFADSISKQHQRINQIFPNSSFPKFTLETIQAPMTAGLVDGTGKSWFDLLENTKLKIKKSEFDVALIAAGAFSYPLAAYVKELGKIGIHCGGGLQIFFGVMGNRWNQSPEILKHLNSYWTRPSAEERPPTADGIENACYW